MKKDFEPEDEQVGDKGAVNAKKWRLELISTYESTHIWLFVLSENIFRVLYKTTTIKYLMCCGVVQLYVINTVVQLFNLL